MAARNKIYYPKSHIITGLYTPGKEWMFENGSEYIGPFHKYNDGLVMTGGFYDKDKSERLFPFKPMKQNENNFVYDSLTNIDLSKFVGPKSFRPILVEEDFKRGFINRFLVRKRNDTSAPIIEINEEQFESLNALKSGIDQNLYFGIQLKWKITGPQFDIKENGRIKTHGVVDTNRRTLFIKKREMPNIIQFLGDLSEFSVYSKLTDKKFRNEFNSIFILDTND